MSLAIVLASSVPSSSVLSAISTEPSVAAIAACMNAARREFNAEAQFRPTQKRSGNASRVYAFGPVESEGCVVRTFVNTGYAAVTIRGRADPAVVFDICQIRARIAHLRALGNLYWNGSKPDLQARRLRDTNSSIYAILKGYHKASERALALGFGGAGPRDAWRTHNRCAVVGGAPSLARASNGEVIDAHDAVFRFNDHPVRGRWVRSAGNRTTFRMLNSMYFDRPPRDDDQNTQTIQFCSRRLKMLGAVERTAVDGHARRHMVNPEVYRTFYEHFGSGGLTGALGVWFAIGACKRVRLFGFSSPCELGTKYRHYHSNFKFMERVQVNTVKVVLWTHMLRCAGLVEWAPPEDGDDGDHWCSGPKERAG